MFAILPGPADLGYIVGERDEVEQLVTRLTAWLDDQLDDGEISDLDERLGHKWLTTAQASLEFDVPQPSIAWACRRGLIRDAQLDGKTWRFPQRTFLGWLRRRPGRGTSY